MSSPRQKMVVIAPPQPNELEQKKKRQTLERARANHLSKQLQMRLQYAKLKVEHGWQRQNLNEVENLYFHHSHQRHMRHGVSLRMHYTTVGYPHGTPVPAETYVVPSPAPSAVPDRTVGPSPASANDPSSSGSSASPHSQSPSEHAPNVDGRPLSLPPSYPPLQTSLPTGPAPTTLSRPSSALDLSDPAVLARLAQLQVQVQLPSQTQSAPQPLSLAPSRNPSTTVPSAPASTPASQLAQTPAPVPLASIPPHVQLSHPPATHPQSGFAFHVSQTPGSIPLYPVPMSAPHNSATATVATSQSPIPILVPVPISTPALGPTPPIPTSSIPTPTPIAPSALTYDSFWSSHASTTGPTRALYRTHTGFTASATPGGNVAMLTPGGHAAVMTAEGVYVGGGNK